LKEMKKLLQESETEQAPQAPPKDIFDLYLGSREEQARAEAAKEALSKRVGDDVKKIADELEVGFLKKDKEKTIAALMLLVEKQGFLDLLKQDIRYRDYLTSYLNRIGKANLTGAFAINPTEPQFVVYLLKYILQERLELTVEEAARVASHLNSIYMKRGMEKYSQLAFYDLKEKKFKWSM
jgi:hypothetical protein